MIARIARWSHICDPFHALCPARLRICFCRLYSVPIFPLVYGFKMSVSLCVPTYNRAVYLARLLDKIYENGTSIFSEIVVSDNSDNNETQDLCDRFKEKLNLSYYRNAKNIGPYENLKNAFKLAQNELVFYCADDDEPNFDEVSNALDLIKDQPSVSAVYGLIGTYDMAPGSGLFSPVDGPTAVVPQGDAQALLEFIAQVHYDPSAVFIPEVALVRKSNINFDNIITRNSYLFLSLINQLNQSGDILFLPVMLYKSIVQHFSNDIRDRYSSRYAVDPLIWSSYRAGMLQIAANINDDSEETRIYIADLIQNYYLNLVNMVVFNLRNSGLKTESDDLERIIAQERRLFTRSHRQGAP